MKLLFSDLDDTLLNSDKTISEKNIEAIRTMVKKGHGFVLCTGRPLYSTMVLAREYGFVGEGYYVASFNGGQIIDTRDMSEIYHEGITKEVVRLLFDEAKAWGLHAQTYSDECVLVEEDSDYIKWYTSRIKMPYKVVCDVTKELKTNPFKCIVAHMTDHPKLEKFRDEIGPRLSAVTDNIFSNPVLLEFGSINASKGIAVKVLCEKLGVDIKDSIAVGDEENDLAMIEAAGTGIGMVNGVPKVLKAADVITRNDNNHDAIKEIIEDYILC